MIVPESMENKKLILVGGGGHCKSVIEVAEAAGYEILGILDMPEFLGQEVFRYKVIGTDSDIPGFVDAASFMITVGFIKNPAIRIRIYNDIVAAGGKLATIIAPSAYVSRYASLGAGTVVMHKAFVNAGAKVGTNCIINTLANIEHDTTIGNQCHISTGAMINGGCRIGDRVFIGSQSVLANGVDICSDAIVGAGALVRKDIVRKGVYVADNTTNQLYDNKLNIGGGDSPYYLSLRNVA